MELRFRVIISTAHFTPNIEFTTVLRTNNNVRQRRDAHRAEGERKMSRIDRNRAGSTRIRYLVLTVAAIAAWVALPFLVQTSTVGADPVPSLTATLAPPPNTNSPTRGTAFYGPTNAADRVLRVDAFNLPPVASPVATRVFLNDTDIGALIFNAGTINHGVLFLSTANGGTVPFVVAGDVISVRNGNTIIISGAFIPGATPSPTASPSTTPTVSPTTTVTPPIPIRLWAQLSGPAIGGIVPRGNAQYESGAAGTNTVRRLDVFVSFVNLPDGTVDRKSVV